MTYRGWVNAGSMLAMTLAIAGCAGSGGQEADNAVHGNAATRFAEKMTGTHPTAPPAKAYNVEEKTNLLEYAYSYPAQVAAVPALVDKLGGEERQTKTDALKMAKDDSAAAKRSGFPFHPHSLETHWTVTADTPRFLAIESQSYVYTGGAHGMTGYETLLWDRARKRETSIKAVMTSPAAFASAIRARFCAELDRQRAEKRGEPVVPGDDDFTKCIDPMDQVLALTSKGGKLVDGVTVIIGPYAAGPYAEGSYEVALPVDAAMRAAIRTEYQDAFVAP